MTGFDAIFALVAAMLVLLSFSVTRRWILDTGRKAVKKAGDDISAEIVKWVGLGAVGVVGSLTAGVTAVEVSENIAAALRPPERAEAQVVPLDTALEALDLERAAPRSSVPLVSTLPGLSGPLVANAGPGTVVTRRNDISDGAVSIEPVFFDGFESGGFGPEIGSGLWLARFCATFESGFLNNADSAHTGTYSLRCVQSGDLGAWLKDTNCGTICTVSAWVMPAEGSNLTTSGGSAQLKHLFGFGTGDSLSWEDDEPDFGFLFNWDRGAGADGYWFIINESTPCTDPCAEDAHFQYGTTSSKQGGVNDPIEEAVAGYVMDGANGSLTWLATSHFRTWVHMCLEVRLTTTEAAADGYVGWFRDGQVVASNDNFPIGGVNESDEPTGFYIRGAADNITSSPVHYYDDIGIYSGLVCEDLYAAG